MSSVALLPLCLAVISLCLLAITLTVDMTARELRQTLRRLSVMLPEADLARRDARRSLHRINRVLARADAAGRHLESVVHQMCDTASGTLERFASFGASARRFWLEHVGNGAGEEPRRRHRSR